MIVVDVRRPNFKFELLFSFTESSSVLMLSRSIVRSLISMCARAELDVLVQRGGICLIHFLPDVSNKRDAFDKANRILKAEKLRKHEEQVKLDSLEKVDFFPFVHGDLIEKQRNILTDIIKNEQYLAVCDKNEIIAQKKRERNQARLNREANNDIAHR